MLGEEGQGLAIALNSLDGGRAGIAAQAVGIGHAALAFTLDYVREREAFGGPIGRFERAPRKAWNNGSPHSGSPAPIPARRMAPGKW